MAASQRVQALETGVNLLAILQEYLKNPKLIKELEEEIKKLNLLTEEEGKDFHEAKVLVQQRDQLAKEIEQLRQSLASEKSEQIAAMEKRQKDIDAYVADQEQKIAKAQADLDARTEELSARTVRLDQRENQLKEKAAVAKALFKE